MAATERGAPWQTIAITSGACAAFNGAFAKLTTNDLTTSWASIIAKQLDIKLDHQEILEYTLRLAIFGLSFLFTGIMWGLYTRALSLSPSALHVNIVNTSANFIITALLGALIFGEHLSPLWWAGAALLISGSVIIGRREGSEQETKDKGE